MALNALQHVFNQTHSMPAMTQNASQLLRKSVTTFVDDTPSMRKMTQMYLIPRCPCALYFSEDLKSILTCVHQTHSMAAKTINTSIICWPKTFYASEHTKCIPTWVEQTHRKYLKCDSFVLASENESQTLLTKPLFQASDEQKRIYKLHLHMWRTCRWVH